MAIRITGMNSGLDTEAIIQELVSANSAKKTSLEKEQTKLSWKQAAWVSLNAKIKSFYSNSLSNFRFSSSYRKKTTSISSNVASVVAGDNAVNGSQSLVVKQLAKAGYLTGGKLSDDKSVTGNTTISELTSGFAASSGDASGAVESGDAASFTVKSGNKTTEINLTGSSTINDVISKLNSAGVNASFDATNQRIFISVSDSGKDNDFSLTANNVNGLKALSGMGLLTQEELDKNAESNSQLAKLYANGSLDTAAAASFITEKATSYANSMQSALGKASAVQSYYDELAKINEQLAVCEDSEREALQKEAAAIQTKIDTATKNATILNDYYADTYADLLDGVSGDTYAQKLEFVKAQITEAVALDENADTTDLETMQDLLTTMADNEAIYTHEGVTDAQKSYSAAEGIQNRATASVTSDAIAAQEALSIGSDSIYLTGASATAVRISGEDAVLTLNGAEFTSSSNTFSINGLTITAKALSSVTGTDAEGNPVYEETQLTTEDDIDGIYDMIKNFFKEYNNLIKEIDTLYNAESAKDYEPLTSEEKEALSDDEVEEWEKKIKESLLRHDSDLGSVRSTLKNAMLGSFTINGRSISLGSFGISTQSYFDAADNEKGMYHIAGDADDSTSSGGTDLLRTMIASDPDTVTNFFTQLATGLYTSMQKMSGTSGNRTYGNFYNDKTLASQYDDYKDKIRAQETKLNDMEDKYYKMFSAMETSLAKVNSTSSYISSMFS